MNMNDQLNVFYWLKERGEKMVIESKALEVDMPTHEQFAKECEAHGKALAIFELARDVLSFEWVGELEEASEKRRLANHEYDMRTAMEKGVDS
jgi:purine-nucleoside phosphorylase